MKKNAVILAAGYASRFVPLSLEKPKSLIPVKGEILIERQISQLRQAGIREIVIVTGYQKEQFSWLQEKYGVILVENPDYETTNNISSLYYAADYLGDTFLCLADHYYTENLFLEDYAKSAYLAAYAEGPTKEWCLELNDEDEITGVTVGGNDSWYMAGFTWISLDFAEEFVPILKAAYRKEENRNMFWEDLYIAYLEELPAMIAKKAEKGVIFEFDSLDELRVFDWNYLISSGSPILEAIASEKSCTEGELYDFSPIKNEKGRAIGFTYYYQDELFVWKA